MHAFEIQTQIQYFAPLSINLHAVDGKEGKFVSEEDLKAFINPAGWNLGKLDLVRSVCPPAGAAC